MLASGFKERIIAWLQEKGVIPANADGANLKIDVILEMDVHRADGSTEKIVLSSKEDK